MPPPPILAGMALAIIVALIIIWRAMNRKP